MSDLIERLRKRGAEHRREGSFRDALVDEAAAELERLKDQAKTVDCLFALSQEHGKRMVAEVNRLTADNAALRADAERYRWLRDTAPAWEWREIFEVPPERTDTAIDSARAKESGDG